MNYDHLFANLLIYCNLHFALLHVLKRGSFDVWCKYKGIVRKNQIVNIPSQNNIPTQVNGHPHKGGN